MRCLLKILLGVFLFFPLVANAASDEDVDSRIRALEAQIKILMEHKQNTTERIDDVENIIERVDERVGSRAVVNAFEAQSLDIGGIAGSVFTSETAENNSFNGFTINFLELLIKARLDDKWSAFIAPLFAEASFTQYTDPEQRRSVTNANLATAVNVFGYITYEQNNMFNVDFGVFPTPQGIWTPEHFPHAQVIIDSPQMFSPIWQTDEIVPSFTQGVSVRGTYPVEGNILSYNIFAGYNNKIDISGVTNPVDEGEFHWGTRIAYRHSAIGTEIGLNYGQGDRNDDTNVSNPFYTPRSGRAYGQESEYDYYGIDLRVNKGSFEIKSELFATNEDFGRDRLGWYVQPVYNVNSNWAIVARYDFFDNGGNTGDKIEKVVGLIWSPIPAVKFRSELSRVEYEVGTGTTLLGGAYGSADVDVFSLSATYSF